LLLSEDFTGLVEHKTESELLTLATTDPACWQKTEEGWCSPPREVAANKLGLQFAIVTAADVNQVRLANFRLLEDYFDARVPALAAEDVALLKEVFSDATHRTLEELQLDPRVSGDTLLTAIAQGHLHCDLGGTRLDQPAEFPVFLESCYLEAYLATRPGLNAVAAALESVALQEGSRIVWGSTGFTAIAVDAEKVLLASDSGGQMQEMRVDEILRLKEAGTISVQVTPAMSDARAQALELIANASDSSRAAMLHRLPIVQAALAKQPVPESVSARTLAYWVANFREAETLYGMGIVGLLKDRPGNFSARFPEATYTHFNETKKQRWDGNAERTFTDFYSHLLTACERDGLPCPCSKTASKWLHEADSEEERAKNRRGDVEAYKFQPFHFWLDYKTPRHGLYPWHIVHIDHTKIDVEVRLPNGRTRSRRAWLSLAIDAFSRRVLSAILMWDPPSHRTCMLIIRQMIKRWGRVPNTIVVDGGSEFRSVYFELLLATLKIKKKTRPGSKPRAGSVIERLFGISEKEFWHNLLGNTKATKRNVRTVTPETDPKANAVWNLPALQMAADHYFGITYDGNHHGGLGMKPCEAYAQGIAQWGERKHMRWVFNTALEILTMPSPKNPTPMVVPGRGVKINYEYFWSPVFRSGKVEGKRVPVRYDPYDASRAWAHVDGKWHPLKGQHMHLFAGLSQRATKILTDQLRENARAANRRLVINATRLADLLRRTALTEEFLLQVEQDADQASVLMQIFGPGSITGTPTTWAPPATSVTQSRTNPKTSASAKRPAEARPQATKPSYKATINFELLEELQ
jgi:putative transposase